MKWLWDLVDAIEDVQRGVEDLMDPSIQRRIAWANEVGGPLGLAANRDGTLEGDVDGVPVFRRSLWRREGIGQRSWTYTHFWLESPLPGFLVVSEEAALTPFAKLTAGTDIQVGNELDPVFWIRATDGTEGVVRRLLNLPSVLEPLRRLLADDVRIGIDGDQLSMIFDGYHLKSGSRGLADGVALVRALNAAVGDPWTTLAAESGLAAVIPKRRVQGRLNGVALDVRSDANFQTGETVIRARIEPPLPPKTRMLRRGRLRTNQRFEDAFYDGLLAVRSEDMDALRMRVCRESVRGLLLEVVHGNPGSEVNTDDVLLRRAGHLGVDLRECVDLVVDLARALSPAE